MNIECCPCFHYLCTDFNCPRFLCLLHITASFMHWQYLTDVSLLVSVSRSLEGMRTQKQNTFISILEGKVLPFKSIFVFNAWRNYEVTNMHSMVSRDTYHSPVSLLLPAPSLDPDHHNLSLVFYTVNPMHKNFSKF